MAEELFRVRSGFVKGASRDLIRQLLDDLLEDGVLNDGEKDSILEENPATNEKARVVIDTVKRKGDEASRKLIARLQSRDATLFSSLGLSSPQQAAEPPKEQEHLANEIYPVTKSSIARRVALLITNIKFTNPTLDRKGAEVDERNTEELLKSLGYLVVKHTNRTGEQINRDVIEFSKHEKLKETDSVFVVIMSHGKLGTVLGVNSDVDKPDEFPIDNIYKHLGSQNCPALVDKPKVIIIQACRGDKAGSVLLKDGTNPALICDNMEQPPPSVSADEDKLEDDRLRYVHGEKDFISLLSCTPDTVSYRQADLGSLLIQYIVEEFKTSARKDDIEELFRKVMRRFEGFALREKRQMPTKERCSLTKRFYLFPGQ